jgi:Mor family transcriptional regulator
MLTLDAEYPDLLATIARASFGELTQRAGLNEDLAGKISLAVAEAVRVELGGSNHYIVKGRRYRSALLKKQILDLLQARPGDYKGIANELDVTEQWVRTVEARERRERRKP